MQPKTALVVTSIALATDMFVYGLAIPLLPQISAENGAGSGEIGLLFAVYAAALLVATPPVGWLVDRVGTRAPMLLGLLGLAAATLLFASVHALPALMVARALQGAAAAVAWVAGLSLLAAVYPPAKRGKPMGIALSATGIGVLLGPAVGGVLADHFGTRVPFLVAAGVAALDGLARVALIRDVPHSPRELAARVWRHPAMTRLFALTAVGAGLIAFLEPIVPLATHQKFDASSQTIGLMFSLAVLVGATIAPFTGTLADRFPRGALAGAGALTAAAGLFVVSVADTLLLLGLGLTLTLVGGQCVLTPTLAMIADVADTQRPPAYGASFAVYSIAYTSGLMVAPIAAGAGNGALGFGTVTGLAAAVVALLALVTAATGVLRVGPTRRHTWARSLRGDRSRGTRAAASQTSGLRVTRRDAPLNSDSPVPFR